MIVLWAIGFGFDLLNMFVIGSPYLIAATFLLFPYFYYRRKRIQAREKRKRDAKIKKAVEIVMALSDRGVPPEITGEIVGRLLFPGLYEDL